MGWLLANPSIPSVIAGATRPEQLEQNVAGCGWTLSPDEKAEADRLTADLPAPKGPFFMILREYWPKPEALDGSWKAPQAVRVTK